MMTAQELLERNGIRLSDYKPGQHYRTCPRCSAKRRKEHQSLKVFGVKIDADGATCARFLRRDLILEATTKPPPPARPLSRLDQLERRIVVLEQTLGKLIAR